MGQLLGIVGTRGRITIRRPRRLGSSASLNSLPRSGSQTSLASTASYDLQDLPREMALHVLSYLDATDLCLAGCVWNELAQDEALWKSLCKTEWTYASCYARRGEEDGAITSWRKMYMELDEACLTLNGDVEEGVRYCESRGLVNGEAGSLETEWARFLMGTSYKRVHLETRRRFFEKRPAVLDALCPLLDFHGEFLPNALRRYFLIVAPPAQRDAQLSLVLGRFVRRYVSTNPDIGFDVDTIYLLCYSLILLSVDLNCPQIKNKMSKREFIKNTRRACPGVSTDYAGHLYDNIYLRGHVADSTRTTKSKEISAYSLFRRR